MSYNYLKILGGLLYLEYVCKRLFGVHIKLVLHITQKFSGFRHLQRIWGASGNLWQNTWNRVYLAFGENDLLIGLFGEYMIVSFRIIRVLNTCVLLLLYMRNARWFFGVFFLVIGTYALTMSVFWTANFFLLIIEITKWPQCLIKYKIQDDPITEASGIIEKFKKKIVFLCM